LGISLQQKAGTAVPCLTSNLLEAQNMDQLDPKEEEDIKCVAGVLYAGKGTCCNTIRTT